MLTSKQAPHRQGGLPGRRCNRQGHHVGRGHRLPEEHKGHFLRLRQQHLPRGQELGRVPNGQGQHVIVLMSAQTYYILYSETDTCLCNELFPDTDANPFLHCIFMDERLSSR